MYAVWIGLFRTRLAFMCRGTTRCFRFLCCMNTLLGLCFSVTCLLSFYYLFFWSYFKNCLTGAIVVLLHLSAPTPHFLRVLRACNVFPSASSAEKNLLMASVQGSVVCLMKTRYFLYHAASSVSLPFCLSELRGGHGCISCSVWVHGTSGELWARGISAGFQVSWLVMLVNDF